MSNKRYRIAVVPGDGIGTEVIPVGKGCWTVSPPFAASGSNGSILTGLVNATLIAGA